MIVEERLKDTSETRSLQALEQNQVLVDINTFITLKLLYLILPGLPENYPKQGEYRYEREKDERT
jgi:hypothetical protein